MEGRSCRTWVSLVARRLAWALVSPSMVSQLSMVPLHVAEAEPHSGFPAGLCVHLTLLLSVCLIIGSNL